MYRGTSEAVTSTAGLRRGPVSTAIAAALWKSGLGRTGIDLYDHGVIVPGADRAYQNDDTLVVLRPRLLKARSYLRGALHAALTKATE